MIVDAFNAVLRTAISAYAASFSNWSTFAGLVLLSGVTGIAMLWVVGKTSNQRKIELAKKRMQAHLLEMRLYGDEPRILLRAQWNLLRQNGRYLGHMLRPAVFLVVPMLVLYAHLDAIYGMRPLRVGESALVTARTTTTGNAPSLTATGAISVDSASVTTVEDGLTYWRLRAVQEGSGELQLTTPEGTISKSAAAGTGHGYVSAGRARAWWRRLLLTPGEPGPEIRGVSSIEVSYPRSEIGPSGWETHWAVWFFGISILSAFLLKGRFGVVL